MTTRKTLTLTTAIALCASGALAQDVTLTIESWRNDDISIWRNQIIPAFEAAHPGIQLDFQPTAPAQYNSALNSKLDAGTAGDIITCRAFDAALQLFERGQLSDLTDLDGMENFSDVAKSAWSTDDGEQTFCVPLASVIHGFIYNAEIFEELGLEAPETEEEFFAVLDAIEEDGGYIPMAMGINDQWEAATMGFANIGVNYWRGEEGRAALIAGESRLTDDEWVAPFEQLCAGRLIWDGALNRKATRTARTCSRWGARRSIRPGPGKSRAFANKPILKWAPFPRPCRLARMAASSRTTRIWASG